MGLTRLPPGYQRVENEEVRAFFQEKWGKPLPRTGADSAEMMAEARAGNLRAMYIMGENPVLSDRTWPRLRLPWPSLTFSSSRTSSRRKRAGMPMWSCRSQLRRKDGTFTNTERRIQRIRRAIRTGESLPDWQIICQLSARMGYPMEYPSVAAVMAEIASVTPFMEGEL